MFPFSYRTVQNASEGSYKESGSKFLAFAYPVESEKDIKEKIEHLKKKYFDATHHCFAWVLGADRSRFRAFDDGEPNHSAGDPILGQIRSKDLTNILIVVVRYYGGVKLGVGGLMQAYRLATEDALVKASLIEKDVVEKFSLQYPYEETQEVLRLIKDYHIKVIKQEYSEDCVLNGEVKLSEQSGLFKKIELLQTLGHKISHLNLS